jgi:hypothetical protein
MISQQILKHLFPDKFHQVVQSEHDHSKTNSKVIAAPSKPQFRKATPTQPTSPKGTKKKISVASRQEKTPSLSDHRLPMSPAPPTTADYMIPRFNKITLPADSRSTEQQTAGRLKYFIENWKIITSDESVLETVRGYRIPLISKPHQWRKRSGAVAGGPCPPPPIVETRRKIGNVVRIFVVKHTCIYTLHRPAEC